VQRARLGRILVKLGGERSMWLGAMLDWIGRMGSYARVNCSTISTFEDMAGGDIA
jgi:hypothetical protein